MSPVVLEQSRQVLDDAGLIADIRIVPVVGECRGVQAGGTYERVALVNENDLGEAAREYRVAEMQLSARPGQIGGEIGLLGGQGLVFALVHDDPDTDSSVNRLLQALEDEGIFEYTNFDPNFPSGCAEGLEVDVSSILRQYRQGTRVEQSTRVKQSLIGPDRVG